MKKNIKSTCLSSDCYRITPRAFLPQYGIVECRVQNRLSIPCQGETPTAVQRGQVPRQATKSGLVGITPAPSAATIARERTGVLYCSQGNELQAAPFGVPTVYISESRGNGKPMSSCLCHVGQCTPVLLVYCTLCNNRERREKPAGQVKVLLLCHLLKKGPTVTHTHTRHDTSL